MPLPAKMPSKAATQKVGDYSLSQKFTNGYRSREDPTTLTPDVLVPPSQNVLVGTSGRIGSIRGYTLDGIGSTVADSGILSNYDFDNFKGDRRNMRCGFLTSAGNDGKLQFRYVNSAGTVSWIDLKTGLSNVRLSYCDYWDNTNLIKDVLWVDGSNNVYSWNGAVTSVSSATATTITKQGTTSWQQEGFLATGTRTINIGGVTATYSGGESTTTLTGVSVDFSATIAGAEVHQEPITTANSSITGLLATFGQTVIGCGRRNQVYYGSSKSNNLYISKVNNFADVSFTTPTRVAGEGALIPLDAYPLKFIALENRNDENAYDMYISEGLDTWAVIRSTLSADLTKETLEHIRMKVAPLQGVKSERLATKMKNHIVFVGNDTTANFLGYVSYQNVPETVDFSYPIINDMSSYDFTDGCTFYHKNHIYIAIPKHGLMRVYNMTDQTKQQSSSIRGVEDVDPDQPWFWEAPITFPLSGFYTVNGILYGHSYNSSESYKLFDGGSLNGQDITTNATFAYDDHGDRTQSKGSNELWSEGYISQNTKLNATVSGDLDSFTTSQSVVIDGSNQRYVSYGSGGHAIGKNPLGSQPIGGAQTSLTTLPAWFHLASTYTQVPSYLEQTSYSSSGIDQQWELIAYGTNARMTAEGNNDITI